MTMFTEATGNMLEAEVDALVNTVNTVGVMGKGIALQFKNAFPDNYEAYRRACEDEAVRLGEMFVFETRVPGGHAGSSTSPPSSIGAPDPGCTTSHQGSTLSARRSASTRSGRSPSHPSDAAAGDSTGPKCSR